MLFITVSIFYIKHKITYGQSYGTFALPHLMSAGDLCYKACSRRGTIVCSRRLHACCICFRCCVLPALFPEVWGGGGLTNGNVKTENGKRKTHRPSARRSSLQSPPPFALPNVALGSAPLIGYKMTFSHFSKGFIRPNLGEESGCGLVSGYRYPSTLSL